MMHVSFRNKPWNKSKANEFTLLPIVLRQVRKNLFEVETNKTVKQVFSR